jgi:hypothetical protein
MTNTDAFPPVSCLWRKTPQPFHRVLPNDPLINRCCWRQLLAGIATNLSTIALLCGRFLVTDLQVCRHQQAHRGMLSAGLTVGSTPQTQHARYKIYAMRNATHGGDNTQCAVLQDFRSGVHDPHSRVYSMTHLCRSKIWLLSAVVILNREILCIFVMKNWIPIASPTLKHTHTHTHTHTHIHIAVPTSAV